MTEGTMDQAAGGVPIGEEPDGAPAIAPIPGTVKAKRFRPALRYELIGCGFFGHELVGTDAGALRPEDELFARDSDDALRWYRCLRCDSWLPLAPPSAPTRPFPPHARTSRCRCVGGPCGTASCCASLPSPGESTSCSLVRSP